MDDRVRKKKKKKTLQVALTLHCIHERTKSGVNESVLFPSIALEIVMTIRRTRTIESWQNRAATNQMRFRYKKPIIILFNR
jgi:hypothetical protein